MPLRFISGLADCHLPGLYSMVISERESGRVGIRRVFYCGVNCRMHDVWDGADFRLKPHNHRQDITLTRLFGSPRNVLLKTGFGPHRVWCYRFGSALLNGDFALERMHHEDSHLHTQAITEAPLFLGWSVVHTVIAEPRSAWLVEEGELAPEGSSRLWSVNHNLKLSSSGLYRQMESPELSLMESLINTALAGDPQTAPAVLSQHAGGYLKGKANADDSEAPK